MRPIASWLFAVGLLAHPGVASADDWVEVLPDCGERAAPGVALTYPREGLPAVVHAGSDLVVRVGQPTALTPPPGVQQPRALESWSAWLTPRALPVPGTPQTAREAREPIPVVDVRPDGPSSLRYRARLAMPPWLAPGSYDLRLRTPGGAVALRAAVRVLAPRAVPRLAHADAARFGMPFDVVLASDVAADHAAPSHGGPLTLVSSGAVVALRVGERLWALGACADGGAAVADHVRAAHPDAQLAAPGARPFDVEMPVRVTQRAGALHIEAAVTLPEPAEVELLAGGRRAVEVQGGEVSWFALGDGPEAVVGRLRIAPGSSATVRYRVEPSAPLAASLRVPPRARVSAAVRVAVEGAPAGARVLWRLGEAERRFGAQQHASHAFRHSGPVAVRAVVIAPDGRAVRLDGRLDVAGPGGCAAAGCGLALPLALLASRGRRKRARCGGRE